MEHHPFLSLCQAESHWTKCFPQLVFDMLPSDAVSAAAWKFQRQQACTSPRASLEGRKLQAYSQRPSGKQCLSSYMMAATTVARTAAKRSQSQTLWAETAVEDRPMNPPGRQNGPSGHWHRRLRHRHKSITPTGADIYALTAFRLSTDDHRPCIIL